MKTTTLPTSFYENYTIAMLHQLMYNNTPNFYKNQIHNTNSSLGFLNSGSTVANITALRYAKNLTNSCSKENNLNNKDVVICSELSHYSIKKTIALLGLGTHNLITVPIDNKNRICVDALKKTILQCKKKKLKIIALVGITGITEYGSIDPLNVLAEIASSYHIYFHVDAAWGDPIILPKTYKTHIIKGIDKADSITIDFQDQLLLPIKTSFTLFKNPEIVKLIKNNQNRVFENFHKS